MAKVLGTGCEMLGKVMVETAFEVLGGCLRVAGLKEEGEGCLVGKRRGSGGVLFVPWVIRGKKKGGGGAFLLVTG